MQARNALSNCMGHVGRSHTKGFDSEYALMTPTFFLPASIAFTQRRLIHSNNHSPRTYKRTKNALKSECCTGGYSACPSANLRNLKTRSFAFEQKESKVSTEANERIPVDELVVAELDELEGSDLDELYLPLPVDNLEVNANDETEEIDRGSPSDDASHPFFECLTAYGRCITEDGSAGIESFRMQLWRAYLLAWDQKAAFLRKLTTYEVQTLMHAMRSIRSRSQRVERTRRVFNELRSLGHCTRGMFHSLMVAEMEDVARALNKSRFFKMEKKPQTAVTETDDLDDSLLYSPFSGIVSHSKNGQIERVCTVLRAMRKHFKPTQVSYNLLLMAAVKELGAAVAEKWLDTVAGKYLGGSWEACSHSAETPVFGRDVATDTILIQGYANIGDMDKALNLLGAMIHEGREPSVYTWAILIHGYGRLGDLESMQECFEIMQSRNKEPTVVIYESLIGGWLCSDDIEGPSGRRPKSVFSPDPLPFKPESRQSNHKPKLSWATELERRSQSFNIRLSKAMEIFKEMQDRSFEPSTATYTLFMMAHMRHGDHPMVLRLFEDVVSKGLPLENSTYNVLVKSCFKAKDADGAMKVFQRMREDPLVDPDEYTYTILIDGLARCGRINDSFALFEDMRTRGRSAESGEEVGPTESWGHLAPTPVTYQVMLNAYCLAGDMAAAENLVYGVMIEDEIERTARTYNTLIFGYGLCGDLKSARRTFEIMGGSPSGRQWLPWGLRDKTSMANIETYNILIGAHVKARDDEGAMKWYQAMIDAKLEPDIVTYTTLLQSQAQKLDAVGATSIWRQMLLRKLTPNSRTYSPLLKTYARLDPSNSRVQIVKKLMIESIEKERKLMSRAAVDRDGGFQTGSDWDATLNAMDLDAGSSVKISPYHLVLSAHALGGSPKNAETEFVAAEQAGIVPDVKTYDMLIRAYGRVNDIENARKWFDRALADPRITPDSQLFGAMVYSYAKLGDRKEVVQLIRTMCDRGLDPDPFTFTLVMKVTQEQRTHQQLELNT
ncbi:hypothetical protein BJ742DRAFT_171183 [Cladochytrium replicatum]|nr:hypothetical protein BJ742DRAFT_171183 [Cladochytrium replicatum]